MNFAFASVKPKSKALNEDFYFDFETPRGHCFVLLDFVSHDYANLNASLKGKLETIVSSFVSLPSFSAELFLGFIAKEVNNFIHNLAEQAGGPELRFSAALCYLSDDQLSYLLRGTAQISVANAEDLHSLTGGEPDGLSSTLGGREIEAPTGEVQTFVLADKDVVLIMTQSVAETIRRNKVIDWVGLGQSDSQSICDSLLAEGNSGAEDQTLIVLSGPYQRQPDMAANLQFAEDLNSLKEEMKNKAGEIAILELGGKIDNLAAAVAGKADTADLLELKRDVLRFGLNAQANAEKQVESSETSQAVVPETLQRSNSVLLKATLIALVISLGAGFLGGWFFSRRNRPAPEMWSVRTVANQLSITRQNGGTVTMELTRPPKITGEQTFSSFADVQKYVDTIRADPGAVSQLSQIEAGATPSPEAVTSVIVKPGDSLKRFAQNYNVPEERIKALNPTITRWPLIKAGQRVLIPAPAGSSPTTSPAQ
jgi:LysM repeat protein